MGLNNLKFLILGILLVNYCSGAVIRFGEDPSDINKADLEADYDDTINDEIAPEKWDELETLNILPLHKNTVNEISNDIDNTKYELYNGNNKIKPRVEELDNEIDNDEYDEDNEDRKITDEAKDMRTKKVTTNKDDYDNSDNNDDVPLLVNLSSEENEMTSSTTTTEENVQDHDEENDTGNSSEEKDDKQIEKEVEEVTSVTSSTINENTNKTPVICKDVVNEISPNFWYFGIVCKTYDANQDAGKKEVEDDILPGKLAPIDPYLTNAEETIDEINENLEKQLKEINNLLDIILGADDNQEEETKTVYEEETPTIDPLVSDEIFSDPNQIIEVPINPVDKHDSWSFTIPNVGTISGTFTNTVHHQEGPNDEDFENGSEENDINHGYGWIPSQSTYSQLYPVHEVPSYSSPFHPNINYKTSQTWSDLFGLDNMDDDWNLRNTDTNDRHDQYDDVDLEDLYQSMGLY